MPPEAPSNYLFQLLDAGARAALSPVVVTLQARHVLYEPRAPSLYTYFPVSTVISIVSTMEDGASSEVALVGHEGLVGLAGVLGTPEGTTAAVVQVGGVALRVPTAVLRRERLRLPSLRGALDLYTEAHLIQVAQTAACNRLHSVEARLARWLLAVADRVDAKDFRLSQEFMAQMLGVHRPTVSVALQKLRDAGVLTNRGRSLKIADRVGLERVACECYRVLRREFDRLRHPPVVNPDTWPQVIDRIGTREIESMAVATLREISGRLLLASIREQEARGQAEAASRAKDEVLALVSHELRRPLDAILGCCTRLEQRPHEVADGGLRVIRENAEALLKLVDELLDAARVAPER